MDFYEFLSSILNSWPLATVIIFWFIRKQFPSYVAAILKSLSTLIEKITIVTYKNLKVKFAKEEVAKIRNKSNSLANTLKENEVDKLNIFENLLKKNEVAESFEIDYVAELGVAYSPAYDGIGGNGGSESTSYKDPQTYKSIIKSFEEALEVLETTVNHCVQQVAQDMDGKTILEWEFLDKLFYLADEQIISDSMYNILLDISSYKNDEIKYKELKNNEDDFIENLLIFSSVIQKKSKKHIENKNK